jgi:hypothetical protein
MNKINCKVIDKITNKHLINNGTWSFVYKKKNKAIKIQPLYNNKLYNPEIIDQRDIESEIKYLKLLSKSKYFFPLYYSSFICNKDQIIILKYYKLNLINLIKQGITDEMFKNIIYQLIISIDIFQKKTNHFHNDICIENILLKKCEDKIYIDHLKKSIITNNLNVILIDFGNCIPFNDVINIDILLLKKMLINFIYRYINMIYSIGTLFKYCSKFDTFNNYLKNNFKKADIIPFEENKQQNKIKYFLFLFIISQKSFFDFIKNENIFLNNLNQSMLDFLDSLPDNILECLSVFNNYNVIDF